MTQRGVSAADCLLGDRCDDDQACASGLPSGSPCTTPGTLASCPGRVACHVVQHHSLHDAASYMVAWGATAAQS